jgi:hypothetical protein
MLFWLQIGSAVTGIVAAALWFAASAAKAPPASYDGIGSLPAFLNKAGRINKWAAATTAISVLLSATATLLTATGNR